MKTVAVAPYREWIRNNVSQMVEEEKRSGQQDSCYSVFSEFPGGYGANGHPTVATHQKMADEIIEDMQWFKLSERK